MLIIKSCRFRKFPSYIVNGIWWFVVVVFMYLQSYSTERSTDLLYICSKKKTQGGPWAQEGTAGHAPRAHEGHSSTGISRQRTEMLRTRAYFSAANTLLRSRASRGHLNLYNYKADLTQGHFKSGLYFRAFACNRR